MIRVRTPAEQFELAARIYALLDAQGILPSAVMVSRDCVRLHDLEILTVDVYFMHESPRRRAEAILLAELGHEDHVMHDVDYDPLIVRVSQKGTLPFELRALGLVEEETA